MHVTANVYMVNELSNDRKDESETGMRTMRRETEIANRRSCNITVKAQVITWTATQINGHMYMVSIVHSTHPRVLKV